MSERDHLSIGEVLQLLQDEFPDITVSKIRFLESRGLIEPERTPSGYRKFSDTDVERLRWILTQQKVHFLPLKVIRQRLGAGDLDLPDDTGHQDDTDDASRAGVGEEPATPGGEGGSAPTGARSLARQPRTLALSAAELAARAGLRPADVRELQRLGMLVPTSWGNEEVFDDEAVAVATAAGRCKVLGIEARHLRMFKVAAEREAGVYEQLLVPLLKRSVPDREEARARLEELVELGDTLRVAMLRLVLAHHLTDERDS